MCKMGLLLQILSAVNLAHILTTLSRKSKHILWIGWVVHGCFEDKLCAFGKMFKGMWRKKPLGSWLGNGGKCVGLFKVVSCIVTCVSEQVWLLTASIVCSYTFSAKWFLQLNTITCVSFDLSQPNFSSSSVLHGDKMPYRREYTHILST